MFLASCSSTPQSENTPSTTGETMETEVSMTNTELTSSDASIEIKEMISDSPRHQEWVEIDNNGKTIHAFVVYPENKEKSSAVVMIHENK